MLIPLPAPPLQVGPASNYIRSWSPYLLVLLVLQSLVCALRFICLLDIMGGFIMAIAIGLGWYAWSQDMNITFICYYGIFSLINGIFDLVRFIDYAVHVDQVFGEGPNFRNRNLVSGILLATPVVLFPGAFLAWKLYQANEADQGLDAAPTGGAWREEERQPLRPSSSAQRSQFQAFHGEGQRLGTT